MSSGLVDAIAALTQHKGNGLMTQHQGLPVAGYTAQPSENVQMVNINKRDEERLLRSLDQYAINPDVDKRWLAIARTHIEQGFMALNRAIFKPARIELDD